MCFQQLRDGLFEILQSHLSYLFFFSLPLCACEMAQNRLKYCLKDLLTLLHSERPKLYTILAFLSAVVSNPKQPTSQFSTEKNVCTFSN